eukprot:3390050-Rhodomonas_salina.4
MNDTQTGTSSERGRAKVRMGEPQKASVSASYKDVSQYLSHRTESTRRAVCPELNTKHDRIMNRGNMAMPVYKATTQWYLKSFAQLLNGATLLFFLVCGFLVLAKHSDFNVASVQLSSHIIGDGDRSMPANLDVVDWDVVRFCNRDTNLSERDVERCKLSKVPTLYTTVNTDSSIWPGKTMNKPFLLFIMCMIHAMFGVTFIGLPKGSAAHRAFALIKAAVIGLHVVTVMALIAVYQWEWGVGYSSIFIGAVFFMLAMAYIATYLYWEMGDNRQTNAQKTVLLSAMDLNKSMTFYLTRVLCTMPLLLYIVLMDLNANYPDYIYNVAVFTGIAMTLVMILLEEKMFRAKEDLTEVDVNARGYEQWGRVMKVQTYNFKSEKIVYILAVVAMLITFLITIAMAGDFYEIAHTQYAAPSESQVAYSLFFFIKLIEITTSVGFYAVDEIQTLNGSSSTWMPLMIQTANWRYVLFSVLDFVISASLVIQFLINTY